MGTQQESGQQPRVIVYPGSFDPVHLGHLDIARRAARLADQLIVAVYATPNKNLAFPIEQRVQLWEELIAAEHLANVRVARFDGLAVTFAQEVGAQAMLKGLRSGTDFEAEFQQALMNRHMAPEIETLLIATPVAQLFVSSSLVKEIARLHGDLRDVVPPNVARALAERFGG